ncbi:hypothetical protein BS17DRAFT_770386 [Gyrodon lividus]|nr:hypothetical protein BS17DRAFT_770386 [Gyrodon lividus]
MAPVKTFSCSFEDCDSVFYKASELRKHEFGHSNPEKIFKCSTCSFITLQKKNLNIHVARHTGERRFQCPHTVVSPESSGSRSSSDSSMDVLPCEFKTNDPAALTRHRKACHGYVPQGRGRVSQNGTPASCAGAATKASKTTSRSFAAERRKSFLEPSNNNGESTDSGYSTAEPLSSPTNLTWGGGAGPYRGKFNDADASDTAECSSDAPSAGQGHDLGFKWTPDYSASYEFECLRHDLQAEVIFYQKTGREGCLCPEWMVEAGIEGWDESVLEAHKEYYNLS